MKKTVMLLLLMSALSVQAQSLKDALYGGKLKNKPGTVIRKGDDLTAKMDSASADSTEKIAATDSVRAKPAGAGTDSSVKAAASAPAAPAGAPVADSAAAAPQTAPATTDAAAAAPATPEPATPAAKDNTALWKEHINAVLPALKSEVLPSKKIKKGSYYVLVSYVIETDGEVTVDNVFVTPENEYLQQQVKDRLNTETPRMSPVLNSVGTPRKVTKKHNFTLVKE
ncbi:MAG TPA: hypothetical protein VHK69_05480 [Chitinophagaceae bacterium]|jgi:hypothetical protein|nr:hypothetical protein [Chitinophagaceae bacterium]